MIKWAENIIFVFGILLIISMTITDIYEAMNGKAESFFEWAQAHPKYGLLFAAALLVLWLAGLLLRWKWACHWQFNSTLDNRKYRFCFIDYMWYIAEKWSEREHNNLNGSALLFLCWLFAITIPLGIPLMFRCFSQIVAFAVVMIFCFLPSMFCKLRYTTGQCKTIREHYREMKHPGRNLLKIVLISIALAVANTVLMFHLGFIHWA